MKDIPDHFIWLLASVALFVVLLYTRSALSSARYRGRKPKTGARSGQHTGPTPGTGYAFNPNDGTSYLDTKREDIYRSAFELRCAQYQQMAGSRKLAVIVADKVALGKMSDTTAQSLLARVKVGQTTEAQVLEMLKRL